VNELNGEKIDVVMWNPDVPSFIANALSPSQVLSVNLNDAEQIATVIIPDKQLSLAIGKEGQNVRLAAKLTGYHIDIKGASVAEAERVAESKLITDAERETTTVEEVPFEELASTEPIIEPTEVEEAKPSPAPDIPPDPSLVAFEPQMIVEKPQLRFAEDISGPTPTKLGAKSKKKKKTAQERTAEDGIKLKKRRRTQEIPIDDEEY
jgi:N utilization substance protein A